LTGKVALVTGGGRGIGAACAMRLEALGATVAVADLEVGDGGGSRRLALDVADAAAVGAAIEGLVEELGRLDVLVCAAGVLGDLESSTASRAGDADFATALDVNLMGTVNCCRASARHLEAGGWGRIVTFTSLAALRPFERGLGAPYVTSKSAVIGYTLSLAAELGPAGVNVNAVAPGSIDTPMTRSAFDDMDDDDAVSRLPIPRHGRPEDCAGVVEFLCTPLSDYVTGQVIRVDGGLSLTDALSGSGLP